MGATCLDSVGTPCNLAAPGQRLGLKPDHFSLEVLLELSATSTRFRRGKLLEEPVKRTYQPHRKRRVRTHGYRARMKTANGRKVINNRRRKGRRRLGITVYKK